MEGDFDFTGRTSRAATSRASSKSFAASDCTPGCDPCPPPPIGRAPEPRCSPDSLAPDAWSNALEQVLGTQTMTHGGPIAWVEGHVVSIDAPEPPTPVKILPATDSAAFLHSREAIVTARGALLWTDVEDALYPAGWEPAPGSLLRSGASA